MMRKYRRWVAPKLKEFASYCWHDLDSSTEDLGDDSLFAYCTGCYYSFDGGFEDDEWLEEEYCTVLTHLWNLPPDQTDLLAQLMADTAKKHNKFSAKVLRPGGVPLACRQMVKKIRKETNICYGYKRQSESMDKIVKLLTER